MGSWADYLENKMLDHVFGAVTYTPPATLYFGLSTTTIADAGTGITEPSGNGYARKGVTNNTTNFPSAVAGAKTNGADITFDPASGSWGTVTDFFIADALSGGNILAYGVLGTPKAITSGDTAKIASGALSLSQA